MTTPNDRRYSKSHEWVLVENGIATCGITLYAQNALGDVVFADVPDEGDQLKKGDSAGEIESVKAVSDIYAAVSGTVVAVNELVEDEPETVNKSPYVDGWLFKVQLSEPSELDAMLDAVEYDAFIATQA